MRTFNDYLEKKESICIIGLGYVGLPLAVYFAKHFNVVGLDINATRIDELKNGYDNTGEISAELLKSVNIDYSSSMGGLSKCSMVIVTVPTPIDESKKPDLTPIVKASESVGEYMQKGIVVVYESTVYPGVTEDICVPILEEESGLKWKEDFNVGYSPERINPGDKDHTVDKILKVVAGDTNETLSLISAVYGQVITAGIHEAATIKTAEAAKVIENTQRDLNIALMNELSIIFNKLDIDTKAVLEAAGTKWNFLKFEPGLVGGHCIGVDPYYLTYKAESVGYHPEVILAGRRINDNMGKYIAENTVKQLIKANKTVNAANILLLGFTFKENVPDMRNTRVIDIVREIEDYECNLDIVDPIVNSADAKKEYGVEVLNKVPAAKKYAAVILAVKHNEFKENIGFNELHNYMDSDSPVLIDIKGMYNKDQAIENGFKYWRL